MSWGPGGSGDNPGSAEITGTFRSGKNATNGTWEYYLEDAGGDGVGGQYAWGSSGGQLESGQVDVELVVQPGGGTNSASWVIGTANTLVISPASYGNITKAGFYVSTDGIQTSETI